MTSSVSRLRKLGSGSVDYTPRSFDSRSVQSARHFKDGVKGHSRTVINVVRADETKPRMLFDGTPKQTSAASKEAASSQGATASTMQPGSSRPSTSTVGGEEHQLDSPTSSQDPLSITEIDEWSLNQDERSMDPASNAATSLANGQTSPDLTAVPSKTVALRSSPRKPSRDDGLPSIQRRRSMNMPKNVYNFFRLKSKRSFAFGESGQQGATSATTNEPIPTVPKLIEENIHRTTSTQSSPRLPKETPEHAPTNQATALLGSKCPKGRMSPISTNSKSSAHTADPATPVKKDRHIKLSASQMDEANETPLQDVSTLHGGLDVYIPFRTAGSNSASLSAEGDSVDFASRELSRLDRPYDRQDVDATRPVAVASTEAGGRATSSTLLSPAPLRHLSDFSLEGEIEIRHDVSVGQATPSVSNAKDLDISPNVHKTSISSDDKPLPSPPHDDTEHSSVRTEPGLVQNRNKPLPEIVSQPMATVGDQPVVRLSKINSKAQNANIVKRQKSRARTRSVKSSMHPKFRKHSEDTKQLSSLLSPLPTSRRAIDSIIGSLRQQQREKLLQTPSQGSIQGSGNRQPLNPESSNDGGRPASQEVLHSASSSETTTKAAPNVMKMPFDQEKDNSELKFSEVMLVAEHIPISLPEPRQKSSEVQGMILPSTSFSDQDTVRTFRTDRSCSQSSSGKQSAASIVKQKATTALLQPAQPPPTRALPPTPLLPRADQSSRQERFIHHVHTRSSPTIPNFINSQNYFQPPTPQTPSNINRESKSNFFPAFAPLSVDPAHFKPPICVPAAPGQMQSRIEALEKQNALLSAALMAVLRTNGDLDSSRLLDFAELAENKNSNGDNSPAQPLDLKKTDVQEETLQERVEDAKEGAAAES